MADIVLKDRNGNPVNFYGAKYLDVPTPEGVEAPYALYDPETLIPENIAEGVTVGDMVGTRKPGANAPYVEYTYDDSGLIITAKLYGFDRIPASMFRDCTALVSVDMSESPDIKSIGTSAFNNCNALESITIPEGVTSIGNSAFYKCTALTSISFPKSLTSDNVGNAILSSCSGLRSITGIEHWTKIPASFVRDSSGLTSFTIPDSVTSIEDYAFINCSGLTSFVIPANVKAIGKHAFGNNTNIKNVTFKDTSGWYYTSTQGATSGTSITVSNAATAATYLHTTYKNYYWYDNT